VPGEVNGVAKGRSWGGIRSSRPGFTLVEMLIVLLIVGILAGGLLLASMSGSDKAQAVRVVSDLRNLKAAAVQYNASTGTWPAAMADLSDYLDGPLECLGPVCYEVASGETGTFVGFRADLARTGAGVRDRLKGMVGTITLYSDTALSNPYSGERSAVYPVRYAGSGLSASSGGSPEGGSPGSGGSSGTGESSGAGGSSGSGGSSPGGSGGSSLPVGTKITLPGTSPLGWEVPGGVLKITPTGSGAQVQPESGWIIKGFDLQGRQVVNLTSGSGFLLIYKGADGKWYYQKKQGEQPVDIASLEVVKVS